MSNGEQNRAKDACLVGIALAEGRATTGTADGDLESAKGALLTAVLALDPEWSPRASYVLGKLSWDREGAADAAARHLAVALESNHPEWAPAASLVLGVILASKNDLNGARRAYQAAIAGGRPETTANAWFNLGTLHQQRNEVDLAIEAFRQAMAAGQLEFEAKAAVNLGFILFTQLRDAQGARQAFQRAIDTGHREQALLAAGNLRTLEALMTNEVGWRDAQVADEPVDVSVGQGSGSLERRVWEGPGTDREASPSSDAPKVERTK